MAKTAGKDQFPQYLAIDITESAANTLTFQQLQTGGMLFEKRAMVIHKILYNLTLAQINLLAANVDSIRMGFSTSNQLTAITFNNPNIIDYRSILRADFGTAGSGQLVEMPIVTDFTTLPGGGVIVPSAPLFAFIQGVSLVDPLSCNVRALFTIKELNPADYGELVQAMRVIV